MPEIAVHSLPIEPTVVAALRARLAGGVALSSADALEVMRDSYRNYVRYNTPSFRALFAHLLEDRAPLVIHCTAGKDRTGFACALILHALGVPDEVIAEDYLLTNRFYRRDPSASSDLPDDVSAGARDRCKLPSSPPRSRPSAPITAISKAISATAWASARASARGWRRATWNPEFLSAQAGRGIRPALRRRFHFGVEVGDDVLECRNRLLNRGDLHQFPAADRAVAVLQCDNQIPPLLLELNKRQTVIGQISHDVFQSLDWTRIDQYSRIVLQSAYRTRANFS